jgi:hypothetical protein
MNAAIPGLPAIGLRWTIGDVSERGFEALRLSIRGAARIFGQRAAYAVCCNTVPGERVRARVGALPVAVHWHEADRALPDFLAAAFGEDMAEGVAWKLAPLRLFPDRHELSLDNDFVLWELPESVRAWLHAGDPRQCLMAQDVRRCYGQFGPQCPGQAINAGIRGLPPGFDLAAALREAIATRAASAGAPVRFGSELDEQGLQVAALSLAGRLHVVTLDEVSVCSPFHPHLPELGRCGAHFVGLNARHLDWDYYGRPADDCMTAHWARHLPVLRQCTGAPRPHSGAVQGDAGGQAQGGPQVHDGEAVAAAGRHPAVG